MGDVSKSQPLTLAINSGSSSLKISFFDGETELSRGQATATHEGRVHLQLLDAGGHSVVKEQISDDLQERALARLVEISRAHVVGDVAAVGHRVVHGGPEIREHQLITPAVLTSLKAAEHFAPLHIPQALRLIQQAKKIFPNAQQIACLDTAFHRTMPEVAKRLPLPLEYDRRGVHRYGFHGLSYESLVHRLGKSLPERVVLAHLGSGSSLCALRNGISIDTTMGLTPTGGVLMGTRSGDLDPGVLLFLLRSEKASVDDVENLLNHRSGLAGLSGGEADMQMLLMQCSAGDLSAELAVSAYCTSVSKAIGSYAALLGGIDLLVFTGGIGEHSSEIRSRICRVLGFLGLSAAGGKIIALPTEEEQQIARICRTLPSIAGDSDHPLQ